MTSNAADVDGTWVSGKTNVLILWETTNFLCNVSNNVAGCLSAIQAYTTARRAVHPWTIVMITTLPRETAPLITDQTTRDAKNAELVAVDNIVKAAPSTYGMDAVCDVRQAGSPFSLAGYTPSDFSNANAYWAEAPGSRVHLNNAGYGVVAAYVSETLKRLPRRPHQ